MSRARSQCRITGQSHVCAAAVLGSNATIRWSDNHKIGTRKRTTQNLAHYSIPKPKHSFKVLQLPKYRQIYGYIAPNNARWQHNTQRFNTIEYSTLEHWCGVLERCANLELLRLSRPRRVRRVRRTCIFCFTAISSKGNNITLPPAGTLKIVRDAFCDK